MVKHQEGLDTNLNATGHESWMVRRLPNFKGAPPTGQRPTIMLLARVKNNIYIYIYLYLCVSLFLDSIDAFPMLFPVSTEMKQPHFYESDHIF